MLWLNAIFSRAKAMALSHAGRGATSLAVGMAIGQGIALLSIPLLARIYDPKDFGYLTLVVTTVGVVAPIASLRFESALMLPKHAKNATAVLALGTFSAVIVTTICGILLDLAIRFGYAKSFEGLPFFSAWVGVIAFLTAGFTLASQFALRSQRYNSVAARNIYQAAGTAGTQLALFQVATIPGLVAGYAVGRVLGIAPLIVGSRGEISSFKPRDLSRMAKKYWRFPAIFTPAALLNSIALAVPLLFVGTWFGVAEAGQWGMAERVIAIPLTLLATSIGQAVEAQFSNRLRHTHARLTKPYMEASAALATVGLAAAAAVIVLPPLVMPWLLGPDWDQASAIMQAMAPVVAARIVANPMSKSLVILERATLSLLTDVARLLAVLVVVAIVMNTSMSIVATASWMSIVLAFFYAITWISGLWATLRHDSTRRG